MAPVWEANHVWLIFVLTVVWTAYPTAFGSIASTLSVALFVAGLGIIVRGAAYALRSGTSSARQLVAIDTASAVSSILTPFALGAAIGGIASRRVPVGNAAGHLFSSWLNPTSIVIGVLAVASCAYLAAVYLAAGAFRVRALGAGLVAGALAVVGLVVVRSDVRVLFDDLTSGLALTAVIVSAVAGAGTLVLVWRSRFELARYSAALAVAAIVAGWAIAQNPVFLPGLSIRQAAAPHDTLVAVVVAVLAGGAILFPSLGLLFRLVLGGRLRAGESSAEAAAPRHLARAARGGLLARTAVACALVGIGFLNVAEAGWAHAVGVVALLACIVLGFLAVAPGAVRPPEPERAPAADR
jgi:cytochrome d ubiquinol oxidase subunit II